MIIVTGTKRSGTSMWMQILKAAGLQIVGEAFPGDWGDTIRDANQEGFYESPLRNGIYYATNPHPRTGAFLRPHETESMVVKVFAHGLRRTDLAYTHRVLGTIRSVREYQASVSRLYALERAGKLALAARAGHAADRVPEYAYLAPGLEWWNDNYTLLRDALIRRYPLHMVSYDAVLRDPASAVPEVLTWLGAEPSAAAITVVRESLRTQSHDALTDEVPLGLSADQIALCDELYASIDQRIPLSGALIDRLNDVQDELEPVIASAIKRAETAQAAARRAALASARNA